MAEAMPFPNLSKAIRQSLHAQEVQRSFVGSRSRASGSAASGWQSRVSWIGWGRR